MPKCHFIHKAANTIYSSYIIFFSSHKIHFIKFYLYIVYYWSMELRVIAEGLPSSLTVLYTQQSCLYRGYPPSCNLTLQSKGWRHSGGNTKAASALFKNPYLPPAVGGDHCIGVALGTGNLSRISSTTASMVEIQQNTLGHYCAMADVAWSAQWYSNCVRELSPLAVWPTWKQNKGEEQPGRTRAKQIKKCKCVLVKEVRPCCCKCVLDSACRELAH